MGKTLYDKVWDSHEVTVLADGRSQLFIGLHLVHEVTSPQAFGMLREKGIEVAYPHRTFATLDHIIPTDDAQRPFEDSLAEEMVSALTSNTEAHGIEFFDRASGDQGIVHVVGPELGLTQPGMTVCCGDSHTSTHGAFGALAFGIGTSQVRDVFATQTLAMKRLKVRRINVHGTLTRGVFAKDVILHIIKLLGVAGGTGYAYEFGGSVIDDMSLEERMTVCNMAIEGGARIGYVNPDEKTYAYLKGKRFSPSEAHWSEAVAYWESIRSDADAVYDDVIDIDGREIAPTLSWGITPGQCVSVDELVPIGKEGEYEEAYEYMDVQPQDSMKGKKVDVAFIGSCTNSRISDLREVAAHVKGHQVHSTVRALVVPGSMEVARQAEEEGLDQVFEDAGFEWREPGCSMCLAMNPDKLVGRELCASSSNRNFKGRQGSSTGRTVLMSPVMVAAAAIRGEVADAREVFELEGEPV